MDFIIVSDSSSDLLSLDGVSFNSVPLKIMTDVKEYVDNSELDVRDMLSDLSKYKGRSRSACPGIGEYLAAFGDAQYVFCVTITSGLSGSFNAAKGAEKQYMEEHPDRRVHVIDSLSTGPENALLIAKLRELILSGESFDSIVEKITEYHNHTRLIFALESLHNLANNGRVSPIVAKLSGVLGIRIVGRASDKGTLEIIEKSRGANKMLADIVKNMCGDGYCGGRVKIHHADNEESALALKDKIVEKYPDAQIEIAMTRGLCSFYAERGGLLVGFEI
jgi:DegV family protein with EDD domain